MMKNFIDSIVSVSTDSLPGDLLRDVSPNRKAVYSALAPYLQRVKVSIRKDVSFSDLVQAIAHTDVHLIESLAKLQEIQNDVALDSDERSKQMNVLAKSLLEDMVLLQSLVVAVGNEQERFDRTVDSLMDIDTKQKAEKIMQELGVSPSTVIHMLYRQIVLTNGIPFSIHIPQTDGLDLSTALDEEHH